MNQLGDFRKYGSDALGRRTIERDFANGTTQTIYTGNTIETHSPLLTSAVTEEELKVLRGHERTGRPLGDDDFLVRLEKNLGRVLRRQKPGRKGKERQK